MILEIKTRSVSLDSHQTWYRVVDANKTHSQTGLPNSLYWRHQAQLRLTTNMFRYSKAKDPKKIKAYILVVIENTVLPYSLKCK